MTVTRSSGLPATTDEERVAKEATLQVIADVKKSASPAVTQPASASSAVARPSVTSSTILPSRAVSQKATSTQGERKMADIESRWKNNVFLVGAVVFGLAYLWNNTHDLHPLKAEVQKMDIAAEMRIHQGKTDVQLLEEQVKIVQATGGAIPPGWSKPAHVPQASVQQQPIVSQVPVVPISDGTTLRPSTIVPGEQTILSQGFRFQVLGSNDPEVLSAIVIAPHPIKAIRGEYRLVYHYDQSQKVEWVHGDGPLPERVRLFLEEHKQTPGGHQLIELYTKGPIVIET